ncbi:MAG: (d)CMP kinase [Deltaproteobacteria bacterium]|jgi:cytidylate kinase|nr:(d)CMP kinase [Deltaproteobacteria bacterium]
MADSRKWIITIDGPAGSGKSTVAKFLAHELNLLYLDTGALYRSVAYKILVSGMADSDMLGLRELLARTKIHLQKNHEGMTVFIDQEDVGQKIRTEEVAVLASTVSAIPVVREALLPIQRNCARRTGLVAEGRDMGTVVFPEADFKFYLHASAGERGRRRYLELLEKGVTPVYEDILASIALRDKQDREREISPLRIPRDAHVIDTSRMTIQEVISECLAVLQA